MSKDNTACLLSVEGSPQTQTQTQDPLIDIRQISFGIYQWNREHFVEWMDRQAGPPVAVMNRGICVFTRNLTGPTRIWLKSNMSVDVFVLSGD